MIPFLSREENIEAFIRTAKDVSSSAEEADEAAKRLLENGATSCALLLPYLGVCFGFFGLGIVWAI